MVAKKRAKFLVSMGNQTSHKRGQFSHSRDTKKYKIYIISFFFFFSISSDFFTFMLIAWQIFTFRLLTIILVLYIGMNFQFHRSYCGSKVSQVINSNFVSIVHLKDDKNKPRILFSW